MMHARPTSLALACTFGMALLGASGALSAEPKASTQQPAASGNTTVDTDALYDAGRQLFEQFAPPEVKEEYEFPSKEQWDAFMPQLQQLLEADSLEALADRAPEARSMLRGLRAAGADEDLADWLEQRVDEVEGAREARTVPAQPPVRQPPVRPPTKDKRTPPPPKPPATLQPRIPYYGLWLTRVQSRPMPARAAELIPKLREAFAAEGVPAALVWLAEAESSLNPTARSPAGAKGLFQLMPDTARDLGLSTFLPDERSHPEKSARAAARYLRELHGKFGDWPLALAAYNAGEGRVSRTLKARNAKDFAAIADALPAETRMYVPKVCALVAVRAGVSVASL